MAYKSAAEFDRAVKRAVRAAGGDPGQGYRQTLRDRFLCRVFVDGPGRFVLKDGSGMLARIPDARATRDIDFAAIPREGAEEAIAELNRLASRDLGDFCAFVLDKSEESLDENGYSRLLRLRYTTYVGQQEKDPILIDLSLDCEPTFPPERVEPAGRVALEGVATTDYYVWSLPDQLADKLCAIMELQPGGWQSSRMKDLVDVVTYATNKRFDLVQLRQAIASECERRGMKVPASFAAPESWKRGFEAFALKNGVEPKRAPFVSACSLESAFFDPALAGDGEDAEWNPSLEAWKQH